jgi:predicted RNA methylase
MDPQKLISILDRISDRTKTEALEDALKALESLSSESPSPEKVALMPGLGILTDWISFDEENATDLNKDRSQKLLAYLHELGSTLSDTAWLTTNAFDTSPQAAKAVIDELVSLGLGKKKTKILFPACGTGIFSLVLQAYHPSVYANLDITAIDLDPIRCKIFKILNPKAEVICKPFEVATKTYPPEVFDVTIDNVPFGSTRIDDRPIHCFFLKEMTRLTAPGGAIGYLTSTGFLNSVGNTPYRQEQKNLCELVKFWDFPQGAHRRQGTETEIHGLLWVKKAYTMS